MTQVGMDGTSVDTEEAKAKQGKVTGIIIPPPEIRAVADKTAQFVARNGKSFEQRIFASEEGKTAKFNFMKAFDPYHAYYEFKIRYVVYVPKKNIINNNCNYICISFDNNLVYLIISIFKESLKKEAEVLWLRLYQLQLKSRKKYKEMNSLSRNCQ